MDQTYFKCNNAIKDYELWKEIKYSNTKSLICSNLDNYSERESVCCLETEEWTRECKDRGCENVQRDCWCLRCNGRRKLRNKEKAVNNKNVLQIFTILLDNARSLHLLSAPRVKWGQVAAAWHWPVWCLAPGPPPAGRTWRGARSCGRATGAGTRARVLATGSCSCYSCQRGFAKFHRPRLYYSYFLPVSTCLLVWCFQIKEYNKTLC